MIFWQSVMTWRALEPGVDRDADGGFAVSGIRAGVRLGAEFDAGDVFELKVLAAAQRFDDDVAELFYGLELSAIADHILKALVVVLSELAGC